MASCAFVSTFDNLTRSQLRMCIPCHALMTYWTPSMAPAGSPRLISRVVTGRWPSAKRINPRQSSGWTVASYLSLTMSCSDFAMSLRPSRFSWIASSPVLTGRYVSSVWTISSCSPRCGKNTRNVWKAFSKAYLKQNWSWVLQNARWSPPRWVIWGTAWHVAIYSSTLHY